MFAIACVDVYWGIAKDGKQIVMIPDDLRHFKQLTDLNTVVMGRKTYEALPGKKPLPNRRNIILSYSMSVNGQQPPEGFEVYPDVTQVLLHVDDDNTAIIGGESVYEAFLPFCERVCITRVEHDYGADRKFPVDLDWEAAMGKWRRVPIGDPQEFEGIQYRYYQYRRLGSGRLFIPRD